ncbi:MAG: DUF6785 family protein [Candidatus Fervidibacter sp.]|uniref:DUF6785 family protein n=1 Tax=Candidatus Fervidibacter sp. TaxID=3100871 RepID=UPI00404A17BB
MAKETVAALPLPAVSVFRISRLPYLLCLSLLLTTFGGWWMKQAEVIVLASQITESVPPIPALGALFLLLLINLLFKRFFPALALSRSEMLLVYAFCTVATAVPACGSLRFVLSLTTYPIYYDRMQPSLRMDLVVPHIPDWIVPKEFAVIRDLYQGRPDGKVLWDAWAIPIAMWTLFFTVYWMALTGILCVFEKRWREHERLVFPLLYLPMRATEENPPEGLPKFWRDPLMWLGFSLSAFYNALNIANAFFPQFPAPGKFYDLGQYFSTPPLDALVPLTLWYRPEVVGLGYLMPTEVAFTVWFTYALFKIEALFGRMLGWQWAGYPFTQEQGLGSYLATAFLLFYAARYYLWGWLKAIINVKVWSEEGDSLSPREATVWLLIGVVGCLVFMVAAGMNSVLASVYLFLTLLVALVYARIRAEVGAPMVWLFPYYQHKKVILYTLGTERVMGLGGVRNMTAFAVFTFMARGFFHSYTATQFENIRLGTQVGYPVRFWVRLSVFAIIVGVIMGFYFHLVPYYKSGAVNLREGGIWGHWHASAEYSAIVSYRTTPLPPDIPRIAATAFGAILTFLFGVFRFSYPTSPFHPLGFAIAGAYGDLVWFPFLIVWATKFLVLRYGGGRLYRRTVPFMLGFALGHYVVAGVIWGLWSTTGKPPFQRYGVWFG